MCNTGSSLNANRQICMEAPRCEGHLFNDAVIVRDPAYLPYIAAALTPARVGEYYGRVLEQAGPLPVDLFSVPGLSAFKFCRHELHGRRRHPVDFGVRSTEISPTMSRGTTFNTPVSSSQECCPCSIDRTRGAFTLA